jgi:hypothetical protein
VRPPRLVESRRLNIELTEAAYKRLKSIEVASGAASSSEVLRRALSIYDALLTATRGGGKVILRGNGVDREVLILG